MRTVLVAAAVMVENGRVLLTQRKAGTHLEGAWEFPGGKVLPGEDPRVGLRRELEEELGIVAVVGEADRAVLLLFFEATRTSQSPEPRALDVAAFAWAVPGELDPARFPAADLGVLGKVKAKLRSL